MEAWMKKVVILVTIAFVVATSVNAVDNDRRGNYWRALAYSDKVSYVVGLFDGMDMGNWLTTDDAHDAFTDKFRAIFLNITAGQLAEGIDVFYADYRNRS